MVRFKFLLKYIVDVCLLGGDPCIDGKRMEKVLGR
jgi:hypothetical protein